MNIFKKLEFLESKSTTDKEIINYIFNNPKDFVEKDISDIASECYVSIASIYRFCKKIDVKGIQELKLEISHDMKDHNIPDIDFDYPINGKETPYQIIHAMKELYHQSVESCVDILDYEQLQIIASKLNQHNKINFFTSSGNIYFAKNFAFQFAEIGKYINVPVEEYDMWLTAANSDKDTINIIMSFGGRSDILNSIIKILNTNHQEMVFITAGGNHAFDKYSDNMLYLNPNENHYNKISSYSTRLTLLFTLDCLYTCCFKLSYQENKEIKIENYKKINTKSK